MTARLFNFVAALETVDDPGETRMLVYCRASDAVAVPRRHVNGEYESISICVPEQ